MTFNQHAVKMTKLAKQLEQTALDISTLAAYLQRAYSAKPHPAKELQKKRHLGARRLQLEHAAPDLLAALKDVMSLITEEGCPVRDLLCPEADAALLAISKAEGAALELPRELETAQGSEESEI
jgi:hypothetical protein